MGFQNFYRFVHQKLTQPTPTYSLAFFRIAFGLMMSFAMLRFYFRGWVDEFYKEPKLFFPLFDWQWVKPLGGLGLDILVWFLALAGLLIALGLFYRWSMFFFWLGFTYLELLDQTRYLNHYYFVSLLSFILIFLPLDRFFSLKQIITKQKSMLLVPSWVRLCPLLLLSLVYFYAGVAKLNQDWLFYAQPLTIWLKNVDLGWMFLNDLLSQKITAYLFSWAGMFFDLTIVLWLSLKKTRVLAYLAVLFFHLMTAKFFYIGLFPWMMILLTPLFFNPNWPKKLAEKFKKTQLNLDSFSQKNTQKLQPVFKKVWAQKMMAVFLIGFFMVQFLLPLRHWLYTGPTAWTNQGFMFSWRVMLIEKTGFVDFKIVDPKTNQKWRVAPQKYLTDQQTKMMATQPEMILQFVSFLEKEWQKKGYEKVEIFAESWASLNGRAAQRFIDPKINLTNKKISLWQSIDWILPFKNTKPFL